MDKEKIKRSPLFYVGDKYKLMSQLRDLFPNDINNYYEPFVGGGTVFLNVDAKNYYINDVDPNVMKLHQLLIDHADKKDQFYTKVKRIISKYNLSRSYLDDVIPNSLKKQWIKTYFARFNQEGYKELRSAFNKSRKELILELYILLIYGFNRMLRFNSKGEFNLPVGNVDFNNNVVNALEDYFETVKKININLSNQDFIPFMKNRYSKNDFVYVDPPYLITFSEYNKIWNLDKEKELLNKLDLLDSKGVKFALSNVTHYRGRKNSALIGWMNKYKVNAIRSNYISYHNNLTKEIKEVLITNY